MKQKEKQEAIRLRQEQGLSYRQISDILNVSKGTLNIWLKDIKLSNEQQIELDKKDSCKNPIRLGSQKTKEKYLKLRNQYQEDGRNKVKENNLLHAQGCMLYWAEGGKSKNTVDFTNSDINMMKFFIKFLRECYLVENNKIKITINCYLDCGLSQEEIENYWLNELNLERTNLNTTQINKKPSSSKNLKRGKLQYGVCQLRVNNTEILHNIYGAIQEYSNFNNENWLFK